jgi:hypothetical protein
MKLKDVRDATKIAKLTNSYSCEWLVDAQMKYGKKKRFRLDLVIGFLFEYRKW